MSISDTRCTAEQERSECSFSFKALLNEGHSEKKKGAINPAIEIS
jgi:hypothetical protein